MLNLKKTAVAVLAFGSSAVFAGTMGPVCAPGNVTVPCAHTAWDFGVQALYLAPSYTGFNYVGSQVNAGGAEQYVSNNNANYNWGFKLEGSYHFNTGNDVNLNWYHLGSAGQNGRFTTPASAAPAGTNGTFFDRFGGVWAPNGNVSISGNSNWDAINLEFGQHVDFGEFTNIRFHGGLEFARVNASLNMNGIAVTNTASNPNGTVNAQSLTTTSSYNGVGPRLGADMSYDWNNGLGVYANGAVAMLVGNSQFTLNNINGLPGQIVPAAATTPLSFSAKGSSTTINPALEGKLGATYTYAMAQGDLSLDIGWMWVNYFNVIADKAAVRGTTSSDDFGVQGPFVGLKWLGNVA